MANSSINISIKDYSKLCKSLKALNSDAEKAISRTVSDFKSRAPGWVSAAVNEEYLLKKKSEVKDAIVGKKKIGNIKLSGIVVDNIRLIFAGRPLTPVHFRMTPSKPSEKRYKKKQLIPGENVDGFNGKVAPINPFRKYTIKVEIHKGEKKTLDGNDKYNTTPFLASNGYGTYIPFQRRSEKRTDMVSIRTTSIPQMITNEKVSEDIQKRIDEGLSKRLEHHVEQVLKKKQ